MTTSFLTPTRTRGRGTCGDRPTVGAGVRELTLVTAVFVLYRQVRHLTSSDLTAAMANADRVVELERAVGVFSEASLQRLVLRSRVLVDLLDHYYVLVHFTASFGFMAWVFVRHHEAWRRIRCWFLTVTLAGLAIHVVFPLAPPRMLGQHGFVDTLHVYGPNIYPRDVTESAANQLAAMPSLHFAWALIVAAGVISIERTRRSLAVLAHPAVTLVAIVATANHYWLDAIVGGVLVAAAVCWTAVRSARGQVLVELADRPECRVVALGDLDAGGAAQLGRQVEQIHRVEPEVVVEIGVDVVGIDVGCDRRQRSGDVGVCIRDVHGAIGSCRNLVSVVR